MRISLTKILAILLLVCTIVTSLASCDQLAGLLNGLIPGAGDQGEDDPNKGNTEDEPFVHVDYVSQLKLDMNSETLKLEATVQMLIDGDTTHFRVNSSIAENGILKARYLAVNTPESTGQIEPWGKKASDFTKSKLSTAVSIILESDNNKWNVDSSGGRHLVWVWYKSSADGDYRNLNLELLQNGLSKASNVSETRYGDICHKAVMQARTEKLHIYSNQKDPGFYYGDAEVISLKELRLNITSYLQQKVAFEGIVTRDIDDGVYIENYDAETGISYGIYVYYGKTANGDINSILKEGNLVRVVGKVTEFGGSYQVSDVKYNPFEPDDPDNLQKLGEGYAPSFEKITADYFLNGQVNVTVTKLDPETEESVTVNHGVKKFADMAQGTTVSMDNVYVQNVSTQESGSGKGSLTLICVSGGYTFKVFISAHKNFYVNGSMVTADYFQGKTINFKGVIEYHYGNQIELISLRDVEFVD